MNLNRSLFPEGTNVEVKSDEEGLKGVYFSATVIACKNKVRSKRLVCVEFHHLLADENGSERLREFVDISRLRPAFQQQQNQETIEEGDIVDAFYNDGWWMGVVKQVVVEEQGQIKFIVTFNDPPDELQFELSQLRVHHDWVDGIWVRSHNQNQNQVKTGVFSQKKEPKTIQTESTEKTPVIVTGYLSENTHTCPKALILGTVASSSNLEEIALNEDTHSDPMIGKRSMRKRSSGSGRRSLKRGAKRNKDEITALQVEGISPVSTMKQCIEKQRDAVSGLVDEGPSEHQSLTPFVRKTDVLWKTIESMDVFKRIPQTPHFKPLEQYKETMREGLAIGYMVAFSKVVEQVSRLQLNDPKNITDEIMETLADLETYGFDVKVVRGRVTELLEMKNKKEKLVNEAWELSNQILEHINVKNGIDEEIRKLELAKEKEDGEIACLQAKLQETEEGITNLGHNFGTL